MMIDNEYQINNHPAALYNIFKISLTRQQQKALSVLLPETFSFQPFKVTRSIDEESLRSEPKQHKKKNPPPPIKEQKDPDYSGSYIPPPKEIMPAKVESSVGIPGGQAFHQCFTILKKLKKSIYSWPFKQPVDPKALRIPQYFNIVMEPMDLKTIEENLKKQLYSHPAQFHRDIYKILMNSYKFNQKNSEVYATTIEFEEEYLKIVKDAREGKLPPYEPKNKPEDPMISESHINIKEEIPQFEKVLSAPLPEPIKQLKVHTKKEKLQKLQKPEKPQKLEKPQKNQKHQRHEKQQKSQKHNKQIKHEKEDRLQQIKMQKLEDKGFFLDKNQCLNLKEVQQQVNTKIQAQIHQAFYSSKEDLVKNQQVNPFFSIFAEPQQPVVLKEEAMLELPLKETPREKNKQTITEVKNHVEQPQFSLSTQHFKRNKSKIQTKKLREKRPKKDDIILESPPQLEKFKEVTQIQSEKTVLYNQIQKKLADLMKKLNQYQMPNKTKPKVTSKQGHDHPNCTNFTNITASERKKLAEKISSLPSVDLRYIIEICFRNKKKKEKSDVNVYEINLDELDAKVLKELSNFVGMRIKKMKKQNPKLKEDTKKNTKHRYHQEDDEDKDQEQFQIEGEYEEDQPYEPEERNVSPQFEDDFNQRQSSYSPLLDHEGNGNNIPEPIFQDVFGMYDSEDGRQHRRGDEYSNQFNF